MNHLTRHPQLVQFAALLAVFFLLYYSIEPSENNILWRLPAFLAAFPETLSNSVEFLMFEWMPLQIYNVDIEDYEESALLIEITRSISQSSMPRSARTFFDPLVIRVILLRAFPAAFVGRPFGHVSIALRSNLCRAAGSLCPSWTSSGSNEAHRFGPRTCS